MLGALHLQRKDLLTSFGEQLGLLLNECGEVGDLLLERFNFRHWIDITGLFVVVAVVAVVAIVDTNQVDVASLLFVRMM